MTGQPAKLYIAVRADLAPGPQLAQVAHSMAEFSVAYPELTKRWNEISNYLIVVAVPDEAELRRLRYAAEALGLDHTLTEEPDYGGQATALALGPGEMAKRLCAQYPLAGRQEATAA